MSNERAGERARAAARRERRAFTIVEVLFSILVIGILTGLLLVGLNAAQRQARASAERATVRAIAVGIEQFEQEFGFEPPLVHDGGMGGAADPGPMTVPRPVAPRTAAQWEGSPVDRSFSINGEAFAPAVYGANDTFLQGFNGANPAGGLYTRAEAQQRYSKFSVPYFVMGVLGGAVDGIEGPGMAAVTPEGRFRGVETTDVSGAGEGRSTARRRYEPFFEPDSEATSIRRGYRDVVEFREHNLSLGALSPVGVTAEQSPFLTALIDRPRPGRAVREEGTAVRYYRWREGGEGVRSAGNPGGVARGVLDLNIPEVLLDPVLMHEALGGTANSARIEMPTRGSFDLSVDPTGDNSEVKGSTWAIVSAGPDGLFGTEAPEDLARGLGLGRLEGADPGAIREARRQAAADNAVEVGR